MNEPELAGSLAPPPDALAAVTHPDPYPWYAHLVAERPFAWSPEVGGWVAASAMACHAVLASADFGVRPAAEQVPRALAGGAIAALWSRWARMSDGPRHAALKRAIAETLAGVEPERISLAAAAAARGLVGAAGQPARTWLDRFVDEFAPRTLGTLLGIDAGLVPELVTRVRELVRATAPGADPATIAGGELAALGLERRIENLLARAAGSVHGLAHELLARTRAAALDDGYARANTVAVLWQSFDAGAAGLGNTLVALARRPGLRARIAQERALIPAFVAEALRFDPAAHNTRRFAARETSIAGELLRAGDMVLVLLAAADRDPARFDSPERFMLEHAGTARLSFGAGVHRCPGDTLAGSLIAAGVGAVLDRDATEPLDWACFAAVAYRPSLNVRVPAFGDGATA